MHRLWSVLCVAVSPTLTRNLCGMITEVFTLVTRSITMTLVYAGVVVEVSVMVTRYRRQSDGISLGRRVNSRANHLHAPHIVT
ncbi:hypothetical protein J6590_107075 [Homalodisca vitripennis]|nr:hypothetical protein J6590_084025 [Homalodisca vitripennis]KAG8299190.1 hypothetical protein J6590_107075 [Homalodisca vitripennis]